VFTLLDRDSEQRYVVLANSADESTVRLLLGNREEESLTVTLMYFERTIPRRRREFPAGSGH